MSFRRAMPVLAVGLLALVTGTGEQWSHAAQMSIGASGQDAGGARQGETVWFCPMHPDVTSPQSGQCSVCKMLLVSGNPLDTREYELDVTTSTPAVKAGVPFTIVFTVKHPTTGKIIQSFEQVHDKRFHLFVVSRDMSVFEHIHPQQQANGAWTIEATLPKPGYYTLVSDFLPTGGSSQFIVRPLITAGFEGDAESGRPDLELDTLFTKTADSITAQVTFDPTPLQPGEHGHLTFNLTDATTGQPVTDLQPYLGAFGHTLIMSEDQANVLHSHPTPDVFNDISMGAGGPRVMFEGYFPLQGTYRAWTQFLRHDTLSTFTFTFRVPTLEESMRR